jgi:hypothetical protein
MFEMGMQQKMAPVPNLENNANVTKKFQKWHILASQLLTKFLISKKIFLNDGFVRDRSYIQSRMTSQTANFSIKRPSVSKIRPSASISD